MRNLRTKMKSVATLACLLLLIGFNTPALAEDTLPQPGQTIDKTNYETYKHLFPEEFLDAFTTGWDMIEPISITIKESVPNPFPKVFLAASEKNRGKYDLDAEGYISGGAYKEISGLPFPDISPDDQNFAAKFMWNFEYRYQYDDMVAKFINFQRRAGSSVSTSVVESYAIQFQNRMVDAPAPLYETRNNLRSVQFLNVLYPPVQKNFVTFLMRSIDQKAPDTTYIYLPSMRRVLRGEAGQRSTPINSSTQAPDDFQVFSGRIPEFDYKLVGEQKLIVLGDAKIGYTEMKDKKFDNIPVEKENWMVKDVYIFDIIPKDAKYPQGRKRMWVDKENYYAYYGAAYDRAGALWKVWQTAVSIQPSKGIGTSPYITGVLGVDVQLGYTTQLFGDWTLNGNGLTEADAAISAIRRKVR